MDWNIALKYNLPTKAQGEVLANNKERLKNAFKTFGGRMMEYGYWTKTEYEKDYSCAWYIAMPNDGVYYFGKTSAGRVRAVAPVPTGN